MPREDFTHREAPRNLLRVIARPKAAELIGLTDRQLRDLLDLHPEVRRYKHARSTITLVSVDDLEALVAKPSQDGTSNVAPIRSEPASVDEVLAAVGRRRRGTR